MTTYTFQRGETVLLALDAVQGDATTVTSLTSALKAVPAGRSTVDPATPVAASFSVSNRVAAGNDPAGWNLTLSAALSAGLAAGTYLADAKLIVAGGTVITDAIGVRIVEPVTP